MLLAADICSLSCFRTLNPNPCARWVSKSSGSPALEIAQLCSTTKKQRRDDPTRTQKRRCIQYSMRYDILIRPDSRRATKHSGLWMEKGSGPRVSPNNGESHGKVETGRKTRVYSWGVIRECVLCWTLGLF